MVTETKSRIDPAFGAYLQRRRQEELPPDASDDARQFLRLQAAFDFDRARGRGWRPDELARGRLDGNASVSAGGEVFRHEPSLSRELQEQAKSALRTLYAAGAQGRIDPNLLALLESASLGSWAGETQSVYAAMKVAQRAVQGQEQQVQADQQADASKVKVTVFRDFRWTGNEQAKTGEYLITPEQAGDLREWQARRESSAAQRGWSHPEGPGREDMIWPPFIVEPK